MQIKDVGEFPLIARLQQIIETERPDVLVGIGDDVAVLSVQGDELLLATMDIQVEGVHFLRHLTTPEQLGRRALAINLSDIAAMGGRPQFALVSLALPVETELDWAERLYQGLRTEADRYGTAIVGGNVSRAQTEIVVDVALLGRVSRQHLLTRAGAQPGDQVLVTGTLGDATAGLRVGQDADLVTDAAVRDLLLARYLTPIPRVFEAAALAQMQQATAMLDLSDGLSSDIGHICEQSGVSVRLWADRLPISAAVQQVASRLADPAWTLALSGGDDYELCFTAPPTAVDALAEAVMHATGTPVTVIGEVLPADQDRWLVLPDGSEMRLEERGWQHFRT